MLSLDLLDKVAKRLDFRLSIRLSISAVYMEVPYTVVPYKKEHVYGSIIVLWSRLSGSESRKSLGSTAVSRRKVS